MSRNKEDYAHLGLKASTTLVRLELVHRSAPSWLFNSQEGIPPVALVSVQDVVAS